MLTKCPLLLAAKKAHKDPLPDCLRDECEWWVEIDRNVYHVEGCAIRLLAETHA